MSASPSAIIFSIISVLCASHFNALSRLDHAFDRSHCNTITFTNFRLLWRMAIFAPNAQLATTLSTATTNCMNFQFAVTFKTLWLKMLQITRILTTFAVCLHLQKLLGYYPKLMDLVNTNNFNFLFV